MTMTILVRNRYARRCSRQFLSSLDEKGAVASSTSTEKTSHMKNNLLLKIKDP